MPKPIEIFFSYAHDDEALMDDVRRQLVIFDRQKIICKWHDRMITPGSDLGGVIDTRIQRAQIILLFVSPHFLESRYCYNIEMVEAMKRHESGSAKVVPIILRHCLWHSAPFGGLLALPRDGKPVTAWSDKDEACMNVAEGIMQVVSEIRTKVAQPSNNVKIKPFKIVILDDTEAYKTIVTGEPVEWNKLIQALISNPFFPENLRAKIQSVGLSSFLLIDLDRKQLIDQSPQNTAETNTESLALIHKDFMADLPPEIMSEILIRQYIDS